MASTHPYRDDLRDTTRLVRRRLVGRLLGMHALGSLAIGVYLELAYPGNDVLADGPSDLLCLAILQVILLPAAWGWGVLHFRRAHRWANEGRRPDAAERRRSLKEPWGMSARPFVFWLIGAAAVAVMSAVSGTPSARSVDVTQTIVIGGLAVCAGSYLVIEQSMRPLFAYALAGEPPGRPSSLGIRPRLLLAWAVGSGVPLLGLALAPFRRGDTSLTAIVVLAFVGLVGGCGGVLVAANSIAQPLDEVRDALGRVADGSLDTDVTVNDGGEVGQVQAGFNRMVAGLRERRHLQDLLGRHVGHAVAAQALASHPGLTAEQRRASVIFVDIVGSTAMAEVLPPNEVVGTLNTFFAAVVETVAQEGGWVNKFEGDGALCVFGAPGFQADHEARALRAARRLHDRFEELALSHPGLDAGIGVSSGLVVAGNVGTEERYEYTVIGRAVNEAARLTDLAKQRAGRVLASSGAVRSAGAESMYWVDRGRVGLRGQQSPTVIFEPRAAPHHAPTDPVPVVVT